MNNYKISIPEPCNENWGEMTPNDTGRFCDNCSKTVIDFSKMTDNEIKNYLIAQEGKSVCGHFRTDQVKRITITIPSQMLFSQTQFHKIFLLALLFTMGTTLLSCSDNAGNKQKIENVVIEEEEATTVVQDIDNITIEDLPPPPIPKKGEFMDGMVVYERDSVPKCKTIKKPEGLPTLTTVGEVALDFEPKKEESNHIQGDTIITPPQ
ncbi:hypothetical protein DVK85_07470 [Flavobacterium arcticum]|uniref:Uncharacterized protein n=1 Tax=Flavobacterium arcticum TaxID=1784713 RepID=A0A345HBY0_9FLAO|nr:hypothetical protein [Flavobacterium arcticum]AXG74090.1 hypothetical protein DVK85_07470 [Flavobacterium arcticum]KAF2507352.1 hypothetical protein E0W72_12425 [Flavobacterium arcticum]